MEKPNHKLYSRAMLLWSEAHIFLKLCLDQNEIIVFSGYFQIRDNIQIYNLWVSVTKI